MKKTALVVLIALLSVPLFVLGRQAPTPPPIPGQAAQPAPPAPGTNALVDYTRQIKYDGLTMSVLLVNNRTVEASLEGAHEVFTCTREPADGALYPGDAVEGIFRSFEHVHDRAGWANIQRRFHEHQKLRDGEGSGRSAYRRYCRFPEEDRYFPSRLR